MSKERHFLILSVDTDWRHFRRVFIVRKSTQLTLNIQGKRRIACNDGNECGTIPLHVASLIKSSNPLHFAPMFRQAGGDVRTTSYLQTHTNSYLNECFGLLRSNVLSGQECLTSSGSDVLLQIPLSALREEQQRLAVSIGDYNIWIETTVNNWVGLSRLNLTKSSGVELRLRRSYRWSSRLLFDRFPEHVKVDSRVTLIRNRRWREKERRTAKMKRWKRRPFFSSLIHGILFERIGWCQ